MARGIRLPGGDPRLVLHAGSWPGHCPILSPRASALRRCGKRSRALASRPSSTPTRAHSSRRWTSPVSCSPGDQGQHGRQGALPRNIFVERVWRSLKYEEVYLNAYESLTEAARGSDGTSDSTMTFGRIRRWAIRRRPPSTMRRRGSPPHECAGRGAGGLDRQREAVTGCRHRPPTPVARQDNEENRPSRLHLSNARFWSERWGPPQAAGLSVAAVQVLPGWAKRIVVETKD